MLRHELEDGIKQGDLVWFHPAGDKLIPPALSVFVGMKTFDKKYTCAMVFRKDKGKVVPVQANLLSKVKGKEYNESRG